MVYKQGAKKVVAKPGEERLVGKTLNRLCREEMKLKILEDIMIDMTVCEIEGYDKLEYIDDLIGMLTLIRQKKEVKNEQGI